MVASRLARCLYCRHGGSGGDLRRQELRRAISEERLAACRAKIEGLRHKEAPDERLTACTGSIEESHYEGKKQAPSDERLMACRSTAEGCFNKDDLRFALQSRGLYPSSARLKEALEATGLELPIALDEMSSLINHLILTGCKQGLHAVPHAWRGISLKQLQALHSAVVESGWLRQQCSAAAGPPAPEDLFALTTFLIQPVTHSEAKARAKVPQRVLRKAQIPAVPEHPCSYAQLLNKDGLDIDYFVSHCWRHKFSKTLSCLQLYAEDVHESLGKAKPCEVTFWICVFALNQHCVSEELGSSPMAAPFNIALMKARAGVVMVLDENAAPLTRLWCLFEVSRASDLQQPLHLLTEKGLAGGDRTAATPEARNISETLAQRLRTLSAFEAEASIQSDKYAIWFHVGDYLGHPASKDETSFVKWLESPLCADLPVDEAHFHLFDLRVRQLLATPLLQLCLKEGSPAAALEYIAMGAQATVSDFEMLQGLGQSLQTELDVHLFGVDGTATLPWLAARSGSAEELGFLLASKCDLEQTASFPGAKGLASWATQSSTPLMIACHLGHLSVVQVLLEHQAALDTQDAPKRTALTYACVNAPAASKMKAASPWRNFEIVRLLLDSGASVNVGQGVASTALHMASGNGALEVVSLLLERAAFVNAQDGQGGTPLHVAALHGAVKAVQFLLSHRADAEAQKKDGSTPLHRAAFTGHRAVVAALLEHGAEVSVRNSAGDTAQDVAARAGNSEISLLLSPCLTSLDS